MCPLKSPMSRIMSNTSVKWFLAPKRGGGAAIILNALMSDRQILIAALVFSYNLQKE